MFSKLPFYKQYDEMDCGPTCPHTIARYYGRDHTLDHFHKLMHTSREGACLTTLSEAPFPFVKELLKF